MVFNSVFEGLSYGCFLSKSFESISLLSVQLTVSCLASPYALKVQAVMYRRVRIFLPNNTASQSARWLSLGSTQY